MIRVLHVVTHLNRGGVEVMLMNTYRAIERSQVQFDFLVHRSEPGAFDEEVRSLGGRIHVMPPVTLRGLPGYLWRVWSFFGRERGYRVVHSHVSFLSALVLGIAALRGVRVRIAHSHQTRGKSRRRFLASFIGRRLTTAIASHRFACGQEAGVWMFGNKSFEVLPNGIDVLSYTFDPSERDRLRRALGLNAELVVGHVGRFAEEKNHDRVLKIFRTLLDLEPHAKLVLVGDGPLRPRMEVLVESLNMSEHVLFLGVRTDVASIMFAMDVLLFPSFFEGLPVALIEAQCAGLPCVVSDAITDEVKLGESMTFVSLDRSDAEWAAHVAESACVRSRQGTEKVVSEAGYDAHGVATRLTEFYLRTRHDHPSI